MCSVHILLQCPKTKETNIGHESEWAQHSSYLLPLAIIVVSLDQTKWTFGSFTGKANEAIVMGNGFNILLLGYVVHRIAEEYTVCLWKRIVSNFFRGVRCSLKWSETTLRRINTPCDLGVIALSGLSPISPWGNWRSFGPDLTPGRDGLDDCISVCGNLYCQCS